MTSVLIVHSNSKDFAGRSPWQFRHAAQILCLYDRITGCLSWVQPLVSGLGDPFIRRGDMRSLKLGFAGAVVMCLLSATAQAGDCARVAAVGDGLTHDLAVIMSTHGLANIIEAKGRTGKGPVRTKCEPGSFGTECTSWQTACK
jgi:hypothetical protein